jgi:hypothetical protein
MYRKTVFTAILVLCFSLPVFSQDVQAFTMPSARAGGYGGYHAAFGDGFTSFFSNPALLAGAEKQWSAAELTLSMYGPIFSILDIAVHASGDVDLSPVISNKGAAAGVDIAGPISIGLINNGFGFGVFNRTTMDAKATSSKVRATAAEELLIEGGYAFRIVDNGTHIFDAGAMLKLFYRASLSLVSSPLSVTDLFDDFSSKPAQADLGFGLDLGISYSYKDVFRAGLVGYDAFSPVFVTTYDELSNYGSGGSQTNTTIPARIALGVMYTIRREKMERYIDSISLMADYRDFLDYFTAVIPRNPVLQFSLGTEVALLKVFKLRAGIADALPAVGFGIDLTYMQFDFAMRGKELGLDPGVNPTYAIDIGFLFRY